VVVGLHGNHLLLNLRQRLLRFGRRQTHLGDLTKTTRPCDRHHVDTSSQTINARSNQTQRPFHPRVRSRQYTRPVVSLCLSSPNQWTVPVSGAASQFVTPQQ
jgi:hypothetical protein